MRYNFPEHAVSILVCFSALELAVFAYYFATTRVARAGSHDRFAIAVTRWNFRFVAHGFALWQVAAVASYYGLFGGVAQS